MASSTTNNGYPMPVSSLEPYVPNTQGGHGADDQSHSIDGIEQSDSGRTLHHNSRGGFSDENELGVFESSRAGDFQSPEGRAANSLESAEGTAAAAAPQGQKPMKKFVHSFWDPEMAHLRKIAFKILGGTVVITVIVIWLCLPVYWGSLWKANKYTDKLTVRIVNRDSGTVGTTVTSTLLNLTNLNYFTTPASEFVTDEDVANDVIEEGVWAAIVINEGVSDRLVSARQNGLSTWNGSDAIKVYYAQGRQETAIGSYMLPYIQSTLTQLCAKMNAQSSAQYFQANANNATAISLVAQAPATLTNGVWFTLNNLRPYNQPVATAITLVGLIYMLILSFIMTMTNNAVREIIAPFLKTRSYIIYRLVTPICLYLYISFIFVMVNLPFKVHFDAHFTYSGGFFLWWIAFFLGMCSVGLAAEAAITVLGPQFMAFFLVPLIVVNVSVCSLPHELQPWIFKYGLAMPFYNCNRIVRTIIFNTKNDIGMNIGILIAWTAVSFLTITLGTWVYRRKSVNQHNKEVGENETNGLTQA